MTDKKKRGARSKYQDDFPERVEKLARKGMIEADMAKALGISLTSFATYKVDRPNFLASLKRGKQVVDDIVESKLYKRAMGYEVEEIKTEYAVDEDGKQGKAIRATKTVKHILPDVTAQIFWLKNRQPGKWRDKHEHDVDIRAKIVSMDFKPNK